MHIVRAGFIISFIYNIIGISVAAAGLLTPLLSAILMPLSSVSVVTFATFTTLFMARQKHI
jgi:P-type Cu+ transporter